MMAKRRSFEELLNREVRWPQKGDIPFVPSTEPMADATIATDERTHLLLMRSGYKKSADRLVAHATDEQAYRDPLAFPIVFNQRNITIAHCRSPALL